jgi:hypothetical protein
MIATFLSTQFNTIMKWIGFIGLVISVLWSVRKSGRDAEKAVSAQDKAERSEAELNAIKEHQQIIHDTAKLTSDDTNDRLRSGEF